MFGFLRARRRRKILAEAFPAEWQAILHREVGLYGLLDTGERAKVRDDLRVFIAEKSWEGVKDFELNEAMQVIVAANACVLTLAMDGDPLRHVRTIIVQPDEYVPPQVRVEGGIAHAGASATGTAYVHGPVVLSWRHILHNSRNPHDGRNVVLHEFAHQLDFTGGVVDGTPPLPRKDLYPAWKRIMTAEYEQLVQAANHGMGTVIDHYGATNPAEFFAVTTECFFERPVQMRTYHPELYELLRAYYKQDTARRVERA
ncbi:MAG: M90 family metallopeptidase [Planctomycetota bacterium]|jgi:Mlc titration factor MtfA (ptsG expression regulator)